jgi:hypothetical protein
MGDPFLKEFLEIGSVGGKFLLSWGKFLRVESVDPLVERDEVVWIGMDGFELLFTGSLAKKVKRSLGVREGIVLGDRSGFRYDGRGVRGGWVGRGSGGLRRCFWRRSGGRFRLKLPVSGSAWCGDGCNALYCRDRRLQVLCSGGNVLEELV